VTGAPIRGAGQYYGEHIDNLPGEPTVGGEELMGMSRDGLLKRLTYLTTTYVAHPGAMSLSPDGRYIAYWLTIEAGPYPGERLAVADLLTGNVRNYCIAGYPDRSFGKSFPPVWSPDGKSLAVTFPVRMQDSNMFDTNVLVLDLEREVAAQVAESAAVSGWMLPAP
jgi:Tol biopolymer transport system component